MSRGIKAPEFLKLELASFRYAVLMFTKSKTPDHLLFVQVSDFKHSVLILAWILVKILLVLYLKHPGWTVNPSSPTLNTSRNGASTASLGSLFQ